MTCIGVDEAKWVKFLREGCPGDAPSARRFPSRKSSGEAYPSISSHLLRVFASVALALADYNAGPDRMWACGCVPGIPETQSYVADILGLLHGAGDPSGDACVGSRSGSCTERLAPVGGDVNGGWRPRTGDLPRGRGRR
jgi:hypothetical protein